MGFEVVMQALTKLVEPTHLLALTGGVLMGLAFGAIPGLSGVVGMALLIPFTFGMPVSVALALMIGMLSVVTTSDTIPAVMFGIPGTAAAQATVLDGHALAKQGRAEEALSVAFVSSIVGGFIGCLFLGLSIPIIRPLIMSIGSPEFFMLGVLGISMVAALSSGNLIRGVMAGVLGILLAMVGPSPQGVYPRWAFGSLYLYDGIPLVPMVLGLFAVPEMIELYVKGTSLSGKLQTQLSFIARTRAAVRQVFRHWFLVVRSALIGTWVGFVPGLGSGAVDWFAYGQAASTEKGARETFGKGDIRGVIAPESANNAKSGGELIPTLAFGVPGGLAMAIFVGALTIHGVIPGPDMLTRHLDLTLLIIWSIPLANVIGGGLCLLGTRYVARLSTVPAHYLVPLLLSLLVFSSFQTSRQVGDLVVLFVFALLGWGMKVTGWSRPTLILGFVMAPILENYFFISVGRYGAQWLGRPGVIIIGLLMIMTWLFFGLSHFQNRKATTAATESEGHKL